MSKQLTLSATLSVLAMSAMALGLGFGVPSTPATARGATAHGSLIGVLLRA